MNSNNPSNNRPQLSEDEIDLGKLFEKIGNFFLNIILTVIRNIKALILIGVVSVLIAVGFYFLQKPVFKSELILNSRFLTTDFCANVIANLNRYIEEENYSQLQHALKMDKALVENIKELEFSYLFSEEAMEEMEDSVLQHSPFKVSVQVEENKVLDSLGERLKHFIENNPYAKRRELIEKENIKNEINILVSQRKSLDSLKALAVGSLFQPRGGKDALIYGEPYEPLNIYREELSFYNRELALRRQLIESESVEIIQDFTKFRKPRKPVGLYKSIFWGAAIGVLLGLLYLIIKELGNAVSSYEKRRNHSINQS